MNWASARARLGGRPSALVLVRVCLILLIFGELYVTAHVQLPELLHPTRIGSDTSNYFAAGQRLNAGHNLYGPLLAGDRRVPGYPADYPAPLLSPPLVAVIWRPLTILGPRSMTLWWASILVLVVLLASYVAAVGSRRSLLGLGILLAFGWPIGLMLGASYPYPGYHSPISIAALAGNLNGYLIGLCLVVWWATSRGRPWLAGTAAGLAAVLKLGPFALGWWLVVRRDWAAGKAFLATVVVLVGVGLLGAGIDANLAYVRIVLGGGILPSSLSIPYLLHFWLHIDQRLASPTTIVAAVVGLAIVYLTRRNARVSFLVALLVVIYSSPVVLVGNFALLLAALGPGEVAARSRGNAEATEAPAASSTESSTGAGGSQVRGLDPGPGA